jgi:hypothetical protein
MLASLLHDWEPSCYFIDILLQNQEAYNKSYC